MCLVLGDIDGKIYCALISCKQKTKNRPCGDNDMMCVSLSFFARGSSLAIHRFGHGFRLNSGARAQSL